MVHVLFDKVLLDFKCENNHMWNNFQLAQLSKHKLNSRSRGRLRHMVVGYRIS